MADRRSSLMLLLLLTCCSVLGYKVGFSSTAAITVAAKSRGAEAKALGLYSQALEATRTHDLDQAVKLYQESIDVDPQFALAYNNLARLVYNSLHDLPRALEFLDMGAYVALETDDMLTYAIIHTNIGQLIRQNLTTDASACLQAIAHFDRALAAQPMFVQALFNKASALLGLNKLDAAEELFLQLITLDPLHESAHLDLGALYLTRGDMHQAVHFLEVVIQHSKSPALVSAATSNKVQCLMESGRIAEALDVCERVLQTSPDDAYALANLAIARRTLCLWNGVEELHSRLVERLQRDIEAGVRMLALTPFNSMLLDIPDSLRKTLAQFKSREFEQLQRLEVLPSDGSGIAMGFQHARPLRIGYLSYDFRDHVMAQLTLGLIERHDHRAVTTICYSYGVNDNSELRRQIESGCGVFHDISGVSDLEAAHQIQRDQVDILIDLMAYTKGGRVGITALRPCRMIVNYLGYPGTMGSTYTDFAMVDRMVVPPEIATQTMSEQMVYLPHSYQANLYDPATPACSEENDTVARSHAAHGLPANVIVFCNFNNGGKMEPRSFAVWMAILRRVLDSVLWLLDPSSVHGDLVRESLHAEAKAHGIDPARVIFAQRVGKHEHSLRLRLADIFLDSIIYNAHSTASDALWANLPIVTLWGNTFPSRVAAALISNAMEHSEIVVHSLKDYEDVAVQLAESIHLRRRIRDDLAANALASPLFDSERTANSVEIAYQVMHDVRTHVDAENHARFQLVVNPEASREFRLAENPGPGVVS